MRATSRSLCFLTETTDVTGQNDRAAEQSNGRLALDLPFSATDRCEPKQFSQPTIIIHRDVSPMIRALARVTSPKICRKVVKPAGFSD